MIFFILLFITLCYCTLIIWLIFGIRKVNDLNLKQSSNTNDFSIVVPFRNEEESISNLLKSVLTIDYPIANFEVIFVDDESSDASRNKITDSLKDSKIKYSIINNYRYSNSPKKDAVTNAIKKAQFNWIITTDADCYLPETWLTSYNNFIDSKQPKMVVSPVIYRNDGSFFEEFQYLDFISLQNATIGCFGIEKPFLCNGANLAYRKDIFESLNGFENNNHVASGDDVFLLEKFTERFPNDVHYLKHYDAIVATEPAHSFKTLVQQRVRWAAKTTSYNNWFSKFVGLIVLLMNATILDAFIFNVIGVINFNQLLLFLFLKIIIDHIFLNTTSKFFRRPICVRYYLINSLLYPVFSVYIAFYAMLFNYKWKGRIYRK